MGQLLGSGAVLRLPRVCRIRSQWTRYVPFHPSHSIEGRPFFIYLSSSPGVRKKIDNPKSALFYGALYASGFVRRECALDTNNRA